MVKQLDTACDTADQELGNRGSSLARDGLLPMRFAQHAAKNVSNAHLRAAVVPVWMKPKVHFVPRTVLLNKPCGEVPRAGSCAFVNAKASVSGMRLCARECVRV